MEFFHGNPGDLPPHVRKMLGIRSEEEVEKEKSDSFNVFKDHFSVNWQEVMDKLNAVKVFSTVGNQIATHVVSCNSIECPMNHGGPVTFCNPAVFLKGVRHVCSESENFDEVEAAIISQFWSEKSEESVLSDPRYIAFRSSYDLYVVLIAAWKASTKTPI